MGPVSNVTSHYVETNFAILISPQDEGSNILSQKYQEGVATDAEVDSNKMLQWYA